VNYERPASIAHMLNLVFAYRKGYAGRFMSKVRGRPGYHFLAPYQGRESHGISSQNYRRI
jgi:hypothetical protein